MKDYIVTISSHRAKKDGSFNIFGGQSIVRKEFSDLSSAKDFAVTVSNDLRLGKVPSKLKTTDKTAYVEIVGYQPYNGISSTFGKALIPYTKCKKQKILEKGR